MKVNTNLPDFYSIAPEQFAACERLQAESDVIRRTAFEAECCKVLENMEAEKLIKQTGRRPLIPIFLP